jgi:transglutaminase-like putative cysteine protease
MMKLSGSSRGFLRMEFSPMRGKKSAGWVTLALSVGLILSAASAQQAPTATPRADKAAQGAPSAAPEAAQPALLDRAAELAAAAEVTQAKYPDADDVLVDDFIFVRYEADGTSVTYDETWTKVLTDKGRQDNERMSLGFDEAYSKVSFDLLEVIKPDGRAVPVDVTAQSRVTTQSGQMAENIYDPNLKTLEVGIPGLAVGDILHYRAIHTTFKARVPNTWSDWTELESTSPIRHFVYEVSGPKELPLRSIALKDEVPGTVSFSKSEPDDRILYRWVAHDVPRMYEEPRMPPIYTCVQRLLVSTIGDWREISRWYWNLSLPHYTPTDEMKATVAELTKDLTDRRKKIEALFKFVSQKVRYMGITLEKESPGYEPHDVRITFDNKYGVCRDKAALLVEMLRLADIEAFPVLIEVGPKKDPDVPQPYFNHAIAAAREPDGSYLLMDPTDENTRELFPAYLSNDSYLVATPEGETLKTTPIVPATENLMRIETTGRVNAAGDLTAESVLHFDGINDNAYRDFFSRTPPEERRQFFEGLVRRTATGARLTRFELTPSDLTDTASPLTARLWFEARGLPITNGQTLMLPLPGIGARVGLVNFILGGVGLEKRKYPLVTDIACGLEERLTLKAEDLGATLALPAYDAVENDAVSFSESLARDGETLTRQEKFLLKVVEFTPAQYLTLKGALRTMEYDERQKAIFAALQPPADAEILSDRTEIELADAHSWTETEAVRLKVLTYGGKKRNSEIKFAYNPVWAELTLEGATVTNPDGSVHAAKKEEQNLMDAEWVGSAPRYPAAKLLVVSLPGVEIGSVIEYQVKRLFRDRPFFAARVAFRGMNPVRLRTLSVTVPAGVQLAVQPRFEGALRAQSESLDGAMRYEWSVADQPAVQSEMLLPPSWAYLPTVCLSAGNWRSYGAEVQARLIEAASGQKDAQRRAKELIRGAADDAARITAIRNFVARHMRAAGPGLDELPLSAVTPADRTLQEAYGNSADRAVLLHAMLRAAGFRPAFILASGTNVVPRVRPPLDGAPSPADFSEVLVRVRLDGRDVYLNDTDEYAALGATGHDGRYGLGLDAGKLFTLRAWPEMRDRSEEDFAVTVQADGEAVIRKRTNYYGSAYAEARRRFAEMVPEERRRYFQNAVAEISQAAVAEGDLETEFDSYPGVEQFTVRVPRYAIGVGDYLYLTMPESLRDAFGFRSETRENPILWPGPRRIAIRTLLTLPQEFARLILQPPDIEWKAPQDAGTIRVLSYRKKEDAAQAGSSGGDAAYVIEQTLNLSPALIPATDYDGLLSIQRLLNHPSARTILAASDRTGTQAPQ